MAKSLVEFRDPADLPESSYWPDTASIIDRDEPENDHRYVAQLFCDALVFLSDGTGSLVGMGVKARRLLSTVAPHRITPYPGETPLFAEDDASALFAALYRVWNWMADASGKTFVDLGVRAHILLALTRADLLNGMTLEEIGALDNSTRQNSGKLISDLRDILGGALRAPAMKSEATRDKCHNAHKKGGK